MKTKIKQGGIFFLGIALAVGAAVSSGLIHNFVNVKEVGAASQTATLVTNVSQLSSGDNIVITNIIGDKALSTTQGSNNRSSQSVTLNGSLLSFDDSTTEIITLGTSNSHWTLYANTTPGYLYAASSSNNYLRTQSTNNANGEWTIELNGDSEATIEAQGTNTRNLLQYNTSATLFACYSSGQQSVKIFKIDSAKEFLSLSVSGTLVKTLYYAGESFDSAGLTINANYSDSSTADVTSECTFSPDPLTAGVTSVTASYTEGEVTKTVNIGGFSVSTRSVTSISVLANPTKTSYTIGQSFDPAGMIIRAVYNDGPTNDDYTAYTYSPTSAFDSLGEKTITITSTENASATTTLTVNVQEYAEGTFTISAKDDSYLNPYDVVETLLPGLDIAKSDPNLENLTIVSIKDFRLSSTKSGISHLGTLTLGANDTTGGEMVIDLPDNLFATEVKLNGIQVLSSTTFKVNEVTNNAVDGTSVIAHIYSNTITISSLESNSRIWFDSFEIVAKSASNSAIDYGAHFLATTADECSSLSVSLGTWNNLKGLYENADSAVQNVIKAADADVGGSDLEKAIARYTFIAEKYGYDDFMDLGIVSGANQFNVIADNKMNIAIIIVVSLIGVSVLVGYRLVYKKKED